MESDEKDSTNQGRYPGFGAIFMSSSSTKEECFRLRLFGLPSLQGPFVKRVKKGMILFLFEFEKRELHGVFQACSDGAMNIVPTAWSRSGKKFPAQVRVYPIWRCHPLPESEFGDAIEENYFSKVKFNFGLSKAQVWRLLMLFNMRKLKSPRPQRALARNTFAKLVDSEDFDGELDDGRLSRDKVGNVRNVDNELQSIIRRRYLGQLPGKVERDDARFGNGADVDLEHGALPSTEHIRSSQNGRGDGNLAMCGGDGSVGHLDGPFYSGVPLQETYSVQDCDGQNEIPSSYPLSPGNYPSFLVDRGHPVAIQNKPVHERGPFTANVTSSEEIQCQSPCRCHSANLKSVDCHKCKCSNNKISDRMLSSDLEEHRSSVFSRLKSNTPGWCLENLGHEENVKDTPSVDEVMEMLRKSQNSWMGVEKSKLHRRQQGNVGKSRNVKQNFVKSELEMIPEKSNTAASPTGDRDDRSSKNTLFLDFKRRSQKVDSNTNGQSAGSEGLILEQCKRRKLIRPNFSENEPHSCKIAGGKERKLANSNSSQESSAQFSIGEDTGGKRRKLARPNFRENESSPISSSQCSVGEDAGRSCESFVGSQGKSSLQGAESSHNDEKIDTECSKYGRETIKGNFGGSHEIGDDSGNKCLCAYPVNTCLHVQPSVDEFSFSEDANFKKLVGPDFRKNELFQVLPHECSSGEFGGENYEALVGSQGNIDAQRFTTAEMEVKPESSGESHEIGDESGKDPVGSRIAIILPNQLESPQQKGSRNNMQEAPQFRDNDAIGYSSRGREIDVRIERFVDSVECGNEYGMESAQVVGTVIPGAPENSELTRMSEDFPETDQMTVLELETQPNDTIDYSSRGREIDVKIERSVDSVKGGNDYGMESVQVVGTGMPRAPENLLTRMSEDFPETDQMPVLELETQPKTNSGTSYGFSEIEGDRGSELEVLSIVEPCANINASNRVNEAVDETRRENKRLWSILTSRLQLLRNAQQQ